MINCKLNFSIYVKVMIRMRQLILLFLMKIKEFFLMQEMIEIML